MRFDFAFFTFGFTLSGLCGAFIAPRERGFEAHLSFFLVKHSVLWILPTCARHPLSFSSRARFVAHERNYQKNMFLPIGWLLICQVVM
jgi:hypothetical protein